SFHLHRRPCPLPFFPAGLSPPLGIRGVGRLVLCPALLFRELACPSLRALLPLHEPGSRSWPPRGSAGGDRLKASRAPERDPPHGPDPARHLLLCSGNGPGSGEVSRLPRQGRGPVRSQSPGGCPRVATPPANPGHRGAAAGGAQKPLRGNSMDGASIDTS